MTDADAARWMTTAVALARRGAGVVSPGALVGCVLVGPGGELWGEGWYGTWGGPHAEVWAVRDAERRGWGARLAEATAVVTLEPCAHWGKTPPCAEMLVERGIRRVVVAHLDPFAEVAGRGVAILRAAGAEVTVGVGEAEARRVNAAFLKHVVTGRPRVTLKVAATLDGQIATASGDSRWVTGDAARAHVHRMRAETDAVLVGSGTARMDDPALTVRSVPLARARSGRRSGGQTQPLRIVLDRRAALPRSLTVFTDGAAPTLRVVADGPSADGATSLPGVSTWRVPETDGHLDLGALLDRLGAEPVGERRVVQSVLVEAGPGLATALLRAGLVDRLEWFVAPKILGAGTPAVGDLGAARMADALRGRDVRWEIVGEDVLMTAELLANTADGAE